MDEQIRLASFEWLRKQTEIFGETLQRKILEDGFTYLGQIIKLVGPQGI